MLNTVHYLPQKMARVKNNILVITDAQIWEKSKRHHKMLGAWIKFHSQNPYTLGVTIQNSVVQAIGTQDLCTPAHNTQLLS